MQFGLQEIMRDQKFTNVERCHIELNDVFAVIDLLNDEIAFNFKADALQIQKKKIKINKYWKKSLNLGMVTDKVTQINN